jgi:hypothetical protein
MMVDEPLDIPAIRDSVTLRRLIEEVRLEREDGIPRGYNRTYSRHNRSGPTFPQPRPLPDPPAEPPP